MKQFKTYDDQLESLERKGLIIENKEEAKKILVEENYYSLINGYKKLFRETTATERKYKENTTFEEVYSLYKFDRELRNIFLKKILKIENKLKSTIAYTFSQKYENDYFELIKYDLTTKKIPQITKLISNLSRAISENAGRKDFIRHYLENHGGFVPLWVLVNVLTMGTIGVFYCCLKQPERQQVAKEFNIKENELQSFTKLLALFRNSCAHEEKIFDTRTRDQITPNKYHDLLNIPRDENNKPLTGINDIFSLVIILKSLLSQKDFIVMSEKIKCSIDDLSKELKVISIDTVFEEMGFPLNWEEIIEK